MIKNKINSILKASLVGAVIIAGLPACTDTWDDHYDQAEGFQSTATATLWEQIQSNGNLSDFAAILSKAKYYEDKNHPMKNYTFKDILNSNEILTVWAPENGSFDAKKWLELCESDGFTVQQQFIGNHIARWRKIANKVAVDSMTMLNTKTVVFDMEHKTVKNIPLTSSNIAAKNGTLHIIGEAIPFEYNIYEYIKQAPELSKLAAYITSKDTTYFNANASVEGPSDANGNPTYVKKEYDESNLLYGYWYMPTGAEWVSYLKGFGTKFDAEDSSYVMVLPTDVAWTAAREQLKNLYNYGAGAYVNKTEENNDVTEDITFNADSLREVCLDMDITTPLLMNINLQSREGVGKLTKETFDGQKGGLEYLLTTRRDTLFTTTEWSQTEMFDGKAPVSLSNGLGYVVDNWNVPKAFYKPNVEIDCSYYSLFQTSKLEGQTNVSTMSFDNFAYDWIAETGKVKNDQYMMLQHVSESGSPSAQFKIKGNVGNETQIMSGKYDIYVVMVPYFYNFKDLDEEATLMIKKNKFQATITYNDGTISSKTGRPNEVSKNSSNKDYEGLKVDTILVFEDFSFPVSYKNIENSYPTIQIRDRATSNNVNKQGYTHNLCIDQILFISKED